MAWPYNTRRWKDVREQKLARDPVCELCGSYMDLEIHHDVPITEDQRRARDEQAAYPDVVLLTVLCKSCHTRETKGVDDKEQLIQAGWSDFLRN